MANKTKTMQQIRQILQAHFRGDGIKSIVRQTGIQRNTVRDYIRRWKELSLGLEAFEGMDDHRLSLVIYRPTEPCGRQVALDTYLEVHLKELKKRGVTRQLLWQEYLSAHPDGYRYTQFCEYLGRHHLRQEAVMHFEHRGGEKMLIDFAGGTLHFIDASSGQRTECQVFVATLPCSGHVYVEAVLSQRLGDFVHCIARSLEYFGGVPACIQSDNLRSAVKRPDRYEPQLTEALEQLSVYYNCAFMAARVGKPRDKASVERHIQLTYEQIYAPLRKQVFHSLNEINTAIGERLRVWCDRPLQGQGGDTRHSRFEQLDAPHLRPLPSLPFCLKYAVLAKVQRNYHVLLGVDKHFYSVPYQYIGQHTNIVYDSQHVEIYIDNQCVATHPRQYRRGYSTNEGHRPAKHRHYVAQQGLSEEDLLRQALCIGPNCHHILQQIWQSPAFREQRHNTCIGILGLAKKFDPQRLENACTRARNAMKPNYLIIRNILQNNLDKVQEQDSTDDPHIPQHHNIRGPAAYA